jgi:diguanylate cyclase (GGDEF)-like protein
MAENPKLDTGIAIEGLSLFQNCPDYVVVVDADWCVHYVNPSFQERFGPAGPVPGTKFFSFLDAPSAVRVGEMQAQLLQGARQIELNHLTPEARTVTLHYCFFPLPARADGRSLVAGIGRDRAGDLATLLEIIQLNLELERSKKELSEANARLELLAMTDQITQIYNRHYFFQVSQHFWEEAKRYKLPLTLMMMDIDNFKVVNDSYGHLFGDFVLQQASARLKTKTRKSDILARYGGEEVVLLAPNTDIQTGLVLAERLRLAVGSEPFNMGNCSASVTISIGISATELGEFPDFEHLLESGDQALYAAKRAGKNCVYQYTGAERQTKMI